MDVRGLVRDSPASRPLLVDRPGRDLLGLVLGPSLSSSWPSFTCSY